MSSLPVRDSRLGSVSWELITRAQTSPNPTKRVSLVSTRASSNAYAPCSADIAQTQLLEEWRPLRLVYQGVLYRCVRGPHTHYAGLTLSTDSTAPDEVVFASEVKKLQAEMFKPIEQCVLLLAFRHRT